MPAGAPPPPPPHTHGGDFNKIVGMSIMINARQAARGQRDGLCSQGEGNKNGTSTSTAHLSDTGFLDVI